MSEETGQNRTEFRFTAARLEAARLLAEGNLTGEQIAEQVGIARSTFYKWRDHPAFMAEVDKCIRRIEATVFRRGIASRVNRVRAQNNRWERMQQVIDERSQDPEMQEVPGGKTGLLTKQTRGIGSGDHFQVVDEYEVDTGLLRELREHEKQVAIELGQWTEKREHSGPDVDEAIEREMALLAREGQTPAPGETETEETGVTGRG